VSHNILVGLVAVQCQLWTCRVDIRLFLLARLQGMKVRTRLLYYSENANLCAHTKLMEETHCSDQDCARFLQNYGPGR
jgi:hypothetical protein